jgi:hypothetical protein
MNEKNSAIHLEETTVRIIAVQVVIVAGVMAWTGWYELALALSVDFALRALAFPAPLSLIGKRIFKGLGLAPIKIFAPPKRFAAGIGASLSLLIAILLFIDQSFLANLASGILIFFAVLESGFKICAGCYLYDWFVAPFINKK